jgi:hypothetical protein
MNSVELFKVDLNLAEFEQLFEVKDVLKKSLASTIKVNCSLV